MSAALPLSLFPILQPLHQLGPRFGELLIQNVFSVLDQADKLAYRVAGAASDVYERDEFPGKPKRMRWSALLWWLAG